MKVGFDGRVRWSGLIGVVRIDWSGVLAHVVLAVLHITVRHRVDCFHPFSLVSFAMAGCQQIHNLMQDSLNMHIGYLLKYTLQE